MKLFISIFSICSILFISCSRTISGQNRNRNVSEMSKVIRFDTVKSDTNSLPIIKGRIFEYPSMSEGASKIIVSAPDYHFETFTKLLDNSYQIKLPRQAIYTIKYACLGYEEVIIENVKLIIGYVYIIDIGLSMKTH